MDSKRFPGKVLWKFLGIPMIEHVYRRACLAISPENIYVASGDLEILSRLKSINCQVLKSTREHLHGMSRVAEAIQILDYKTVIMLQADEILIDPAHLKELIRNIHNTKDAECFNLISKVHDKNQLSDRNVVKCLIDENQDISDIFREDAKYFKFKDIYKIMGTIALTKKSLVNLSLTPDSMSQVKLSIEQMKILESTYALRGVIVNSSYPSVNSPEEVKLVERCIIESYQQRQILNSYINS
jgi:3-deoxy-manno-octulosonate cytidylyltransferase (CMP-KDO synthetase)